MASFTERISVIIDVTTNKAVSGLKDFRSAVSEAQGFTGKLKAGVGSLGSTFGLAAAGPAALGAAVAGGAKIAFDAAQEWAALGEQVDNFATVTGFSYDAASRWIEVAGDLGVEASTLQSTLGKLNKTVNPELFDKLGVSIARTSSGAVDAAGTFENVLQKLRDIKDPTERAQVGAKLLGKSWQSVAPLIARSAQDIKSQLEGVADVKVFTADEIKRSKEFKDKLRELDDKFTELKETVGQEVVPALTDAFGMIIKLADGMAWLDDQTQKLGFSLTDLKLPNPAEWAWDWGWSQLEPVWNAFNREAPKISSSVAGLGDAAGMAARYVGLMGQKQDEAQKTAGKLASNVRETLTAYKNLKSELSTQKSLIDLKIALEGNAQKLKDLKKNFDEGKISGRDYMLEVASTTLDSKLAIEGYAEEIGNIPKDVATDIVLNFDPNAPGNIDDTLNEWARNKTVFVSVALGNVVVDPTKKPDYPGNNPPKPQLPGTGTGSGADPHDAIQRSERFGMSTQNQPNPVNITVNVPPNANLVDIGRATADALAAFYRAGGERV
jgi:hypothetical protein